MLLGALYAFGGILLWHAIPNTHEGLNSYIRTHQYLDEIQRGHFPPLLFNDVNSGAGCPFPLYYPPLAYYITAGIYSLVGHLLISVHFSFWLSVFLSGCTVYGVCKEMSGDRWAAVAGALLYMTAPYRFTLVTVRAALAESWSLVWYPLILLALVRALKGKHVPWYYPLAVAASLLTHTVMSLYFAVICAAICLLFLIFREGRRLVPLLIGAILGLGIAAFHLLPQQVYLGDVWASDPKVMLANTAYVHSHRVHFHQLFSTPPLYWAGVSKPGDQDSMTFDTGTVSFLFLVMALVAGFEWLKGRRRYSAKVFSLSTLALAGWCAAVAFMVFPKAFLPLMPPQYQYIQFPWRLLGLTTLLAAVGFAGFSRVFWHAPGRRIGFFLLAVIVSMAVSPVFQHKSLRQETDNQSITPDSIRASTDFRGTSAAGEFLPRSFPIEQARNFVPPAPAAGEGATIHAWRRKDPNSWELDIASPHDTRAQVPLAYCRLWRARTEAGVPLAMEPAKGLIQIRIPAGNTVVIVERATPSAVKLGLAISLVSLVLLAVGFSVSRRRKHQKRTEKEGDRHVLG